MQKWEYLRHVVSWAAGQPSVDGVLVVPFNEWLNAQGQDGWELVSTMNKSVGSHDRMETYVFKRPLGEAAG
jgi:hypothetical protein